MRDQKNMLAKWQGAKQQEIYANQDHKSQVQESPPIKDTYLS